MRKALVVGIDYYASFTPLYGCVTDSYDVKAVLERNGDGSVNFQVRHLAGSEDRTAISRGDLKDSIQELFSGQSEVALLYFAGHGYIEVTGGYLMASDCARGDEGLSLAHVMQLANQSQALNRVIVLDSCHSGIAGVSPISDKYAEISEGVTILTASTAEQYASEKNGHGVFTSLFVDALRGSAANLLGDITPGSVYAHVDQSLGAWQQRPVFKTNVKRFISLRKVSAPITLEDLRRIVTLFPHPGYVFLLDSTYEPESSNPDPVNTEKFRVLQKYNRNGLVVPVDATHMYHAAISGKSCRLTALGEHYRMLAERGLI